MPRRTTPLTPKQERRAREKFRAAGMSVPAEFLDTMAAYRLVGADDFEINWRIDFCRPEGYR